MYLCEHFGLPDVAAYWEQVIIMNDWQKSRFSQKIVSTLFNTVNGKRIAMLGFAFKKDTNDTRETAAMYVGRDLLDEQAVLAIHDPKVSPEQMFKDLKESKTDADGNPNKQIEICEDPYVAAKGAHGLAIMTEWDSFKELDFKKIYEGMYKPAFVFDGRNILDHEKLREIGFEVFAIGR